MNESEKLSYIIETLNWFDLTLSKDELEKIKKDENISVADYLDKYLIPIIEELYKKRKLNSRSDIQFRGLISLCFKGDLSNKAWQRVCSLLNDQKKIFFTTTKYSLGWPLEIAINEGNLEMIEKLSNIYRDLLPNYPERKYKMHLQLIFSLLRSWVKTEKEQQCLDYVLQLCEKYADPIDTDKPEQGSFSNKKFYDPCFGEERQSITLSEMLLQVCKILLSYKKLKSFNQVYSYLISKITPDEFSRVNDELRGKLKELRGKWKELRGKLKELSASDDKDAETSFCESVSEIITQAENSSASFEKNKNNIQVAFIKHLTDLKTVLESSTNDADFQEGNRLFNTLNEKQKEFFQALPANSTEKEIICKINKFRLICAENIEIADKIMGHGWLYRTVEVVIKAVVGLFAGIGMILGCLFGQGLFNSAHREGFAKTFFKFNQNQQSLALIKFKRRVLGDSEENQGVLSPANFSKIPNP